MKNHQGFLFRPTNGIIRVSAFAFLEGFPSSKWDLTCAVPLLHGNYFRENGPGGVVYGAGGPYSGSNERGVVVLQRGKRGLAGFDQLQPGVLYRLLK
jgi:hypothetical protein